MGEYQRSGLIVVTRLAPSPWQENRVPKGQPSGIASRRRARDWKRYDGIDGEMWTDLAPDDRVKVDAGMASLNDLDRVIAYLRRVAQSDDWKLFFCQCDPRGESLISPGPQFEFCGYDYALLPDEYSEHCYSSILDEIIFGAFPTLAEFINELNDHMLFDTLEACGRYAREHHRLWESGAGVESEDLEQPFVPVAVWLWRDPSDTHPGQSGEPT